MPEDDLCQAKDVCQHVFDHGRALHQSRREGCVGYLLAADDNLTHRLITAQNKESTKIQSGPCSMKSLASIIHPSKEARIGIHEQLRLAFRLAQSVLHYHSTAWWRRTWGLDDISYFDVDEELSVSLQTLHIGATLVPRIKPEHDLEMDSVLANIPSIPLDDQDDERLFYGIRNVTLYCLGAALLQIGHWETLDPTDIVQVRRAEAKPSRLGPVYDGLVKRCLYFDFGGYEPDLSNQELQAAIYGSVVCKLEEMAKVLGGGNVT